VKDDFGWRERTPAGGYDDGCQKEEPAEQELAAEEPAAPVTEEVQTRPPSRVQPGGGHGLRSQCFWEFDFSAVEARCRKSVVVGQRLPEVTAVEIPIVLLNDVVRTE